MSERVPLAIVVMEAEGREVTVGSLDGGLRPDLALVDDLLKFALAACRLGWAVRLRRVQPALRDLVELVGMGERLGLDDDPDPPGDGDGDEPAEGAVAVVLPLRLDALG